MSIEDCHYIAGEDMEVKKGDVLVIKDGVLFLINNEAEATEMLTRAREAYGSDKVRKIIDGLAGVSTE